MSMMFDGGGNMKFEVGDRVKLQPGVISQLKLVHRNSGQKLLELLD